MTCQKLLIALSLLLAALVLLAPAADLLQSRADTLVHALTEQGVGPERILGIDPNGIPIVCGTQEPGTPQMLPGLQAAQLPAGVRGWETIPGVIRNDGVETFRLEVDVNGPVTGVRLTQFSLSILMPQPSPVELRDDGLGADRVAGDFIYTAGPFRYDTRYAAQEFYMYDASSPSGLWVEDFGDLVVEELDGSQTQFLLRPSVGLLRSNISATNIALRSSTVATSPHLINVRSSTRDTQFSLRLLDYNLSRLTNLVYEVLPDAYDFFLFFSTSKIERFPMLSRENFISGIHSSVQVNYSGTGLDVYDFSRFYGSQGKLLGLNVLDAYERGVLSNTATHEILHQWAAFLDTTLGLTDGTGHYNRRCSAASLEGGFQWNDIGNGAFAFNCEEGQSGGHHAPPLDKYVMGLIHGAAVPQLYVMSNESSINAKCAGDPVLPQEIVARISIADIQGVHGIRSPGPAGAQRNFSLAFVAESHDRFLNPTEMTYYDILAEHYAREVPVGAPDPYVGFNWAPVTRYFQEGTTWRSAISPVSVSVTPPAVNLGGGESRTFAATVTGSPNTAVTWSRTPQLGTIASNGVYTAPASVERETTVVVKATSMADPSKTGLGIVSSRLPAGARASVFWPARILAAAHWSDSQSSMKEPRMLRQTGESRTA
ncbi:MAG: hypothetical protein KIT09_13365 [Bryobacteraceae bacterium]|nr:hypothetical protein [Bryobacteraceae bacterium]